MKAVLLALALSIALITWWANPAQAEHRPGCFSPERIYQMLANDGMVNVFKGIAGAGLMGLWVNPETENWAVLSFYKDGEACITGTGYGYGLMNPDDMTKPIPNAKES